MENPVPQEPPKAPLVKYCVSCGRQMPFEMNFCEHCGKKQIRDSNHVPVQASKSKNLSFLRLVFALWCFGYWTLMPMPQELAGHMDWFSSASITIFLCMAMVSFVPLLWKRQPALLLVLAALCYYTYLALRILLNGSMDECREYINGACLFNGNTYAGNWRAFFGFDVLGICLFGLYFTFSHHVKDVYGANFRSFFVASKGGTSCGERQPSAISSPSTAPLTVAPLVSSARPLIRAMITIIIVVVLFILGVVAVSVHRFSKVVQGSLVSKDVQECMTELDGSTHCDFLRRNIAGIDIDLRQCTKEELMAGKAPCWADQPIPGHVVSELERLPKAEWVHLPTAEIRMVNGVHSRYTGHPFVLAFCKPGLRCYSGPTLNIDIKGPFYSVDRVDLDRFPSRPPLLLIPIKVIGDSDWIPVTGSEMKLIVFGAKRRWRSYPA